jgi:putative hydrolase
VARLVETTELRIEPQALLQRVRSFDPRPVIEGLRKGDLIRLLAGEERRELLDELQATMAVIEGYSDHVMDAVGEQLDPRYGEMRDRFEQQRTNRSPLELLITRLLGLDMKLRQYSLGKAFADATSERAGIEGLNRVWSEPAALPSLEELERPELWLARTGLAAVR